MKLYINSKYLDNQNANDITINFNPALVGYSKIRLLQCKLYNSWYNITELNNKLYCHNGIKWTTKTLPPGNYNISTLNNMLNKNITLKHNDATGKINIKLDNNFKIDFTKDDSFAELLGFNKKIFDKENQTGAFRSDFSPVKDYAIYCDIIDSPNNYFNGERSRYLEILPLRNTIDISDEVSYEFPDSIYTEIRQSEKFNINLSITQVNGNNINFHGFPVSYVLELI